MNATSVQKRAQILDAAAQVFTRYGYHRTSMADIAEAAGISRSAIYLLFQNKEDVFRSLADYVLGGSLQAASAALKGEAPLVERITRAVLTFEEPLFEIAHNSAHGDELVEANTSLAAEKMREANAKLVRLLAKAIRDAEASGDVNLARLATRPKAFAELLLASVVGLKKDSATVNDFRKRVQTVCAIFVGSITMDA